VNGLDLVLVLLAVAFAFAGLRQGFLVSTVSFCGFFVGAVLGLVLMPRVLGGQPESTLRSVLAVGGVLVLAVVVQAVAAWAAAQVKERITWRPARRVDAVGGAIVSVIAVLAAAWLVGTALLRTDSSSGLADQARGSHLLSALDSVIPTRPDQVFSAFGDLLDTTGFPRVFNDLQLERPTPVPPPDGRVVTSLPVRRAADSTVKVLGSAPSCSRRIEGSGFVFAADRVMTNAHVLAGVSNPMVYVGGRGQGFPAHVVVFDPATDVAVLWVPGLRLPVVPFAGPAAGGTDAAAIGYPGDGPLSIVAARIRGTTRAAGQDIYGDGRVVREVYSVRAAVHPGNSGGPLVDPTGRAVGVIFAASREDPQTAYALTAAEVASQARAGATAVDDVATGRCT